MTLVFVIINGCKDNADQTFKSLLQKAVDFTPFCEGPYRKYFENFKRVLIVGMYVLFFVFIFIFFVFFCVWLYRFHAYCFFFFSKYFFCAKAQLFQKNKVCL